MNLTFLNCLDEAGHAHRAGRDDRALELLEHAKAALVAPQYPRVRPEDDPKRSPLDRAFWRLARG